MLLGGIPAADIAPRRRHTIMRNSNSTRLGNAEASAFPLGML
jgi:hypothetical protein